MYSYSDDDFKRLGAHKFVSRVAELFDREEMRVVLSYSGVRYPLPYGDAPIIGERFDVMNDEYISKLRRRTCVALAAQEWFHKTAPPWARAIGLPVNNRDCQKLEQDENLFLNLVGYYGRSLMEAGLDFLLHPSLADCCSGLRAHRDTPDFLHAELQEFRPRPLEGLKVWWETGFEFFDDRPHEPIKVLTGLSWSSPEMIFEELQYLIQARQRSRDRGADEDTLLHQWDEAIATVGQRGYECYPSKFAPNSRTF
jgi:hypothetical protein